MYNTNMKLKTQLLYQAQVQINHMMHKFHNVIMTYTCIHIYTKQSLSTFLTKEKEYCNLNIK